METLASGESIAGEVSRANLRWIIQLVFPNPHPPTGSCLPLPHDAG
jgi:hypothetical protein